ncbi:MAG: hypothetical protein Q8941_22275 [Bacteroidota bacterium]|nr:hypothetical protein [Bacteroidota bacterium]
MDQDMKNPAFDKVLMTGVFVGIIITVILLFYHVIFLQSTDFPFSTMINVSTLIFSVNLLFLVIGPVYYGFIKLSKYGNILYMIVFILLTIFLVMKTKGVDRTDDDQLNIEFRQLLSGIIIITGIGISFLLPFLFYNKSFRKNVI